MNAALTKLTKARIALLLDQPFFGTLLLGLKCIEDKTGIARGTMATDGIHLYWDKKFVESLPEPVLRTVLAHEVMHCALLHMLRRKERDPLAWNWAIDHAVNLILDECNASAGQKGRAKPFEWGDLDKHVLHDPAYKGMSGEEIYARLPKQGSGGGGSGKGKGKGQSSQPSQYPHGPGGVLDAPPDQIEQQKIEAQWKINVVQAATAAKMQGKLPAEMQRFVDEMINPQVPWQELLRQFVRSAAKDDYSFRKFNQRYMHTGFMLPALYSQRLGRIAIAIDTSGSIGGDILNAFISEVEGICHETRPEKVVILDCDAEVHSVTEYEATDPLPREFKGGGGTSHVPVFEELDKDPPEVCVCFTDLYTTFPDVEPAYPVIWAVYGGNEAEAPFGQTVRIKA